MWPASWGDVEKHMRANTIAAGMLGALALAGVAPAAMAQARLTATIDGVNSDKGQVIAALCSDAAANFPGRCKGYQALAPAKAGAVTVTFDDLPAGTYALQVFHDDNGDKMPQTPPEGYAYGNDTPYPPSFEKAAIKVEGDTATKTTMQYLGAPIVMKGGSKGAAPGLGVERIDVRENGLYAEFYVPKSDKKLPAIILIGGSEGGLDTMSRMAGGFNAEGYAVLVLAYFAEQGLSPSLTTIQVEYFDRALAWVKARPEVNAKRIGAVGGSRGSEAVLLMASRNRDVRAVMAFAPSGVLWQGLGATPMSFAPAWILAGEPMPYVVPDGSKYSPTGYRAMFEGALAKGVKPETVIPVEKINGPVLLISGEDDKLWPSTPMADAIIARLDEKKFKFAHTHLHYPSVGHIVFMGEASHIPADYSPSIGPIPLGGEVKAAHAAWADNWPKTVKFFDDALKAKR